VIFDWSRQLGKCLGAYPEEPSVFGVLVVRSGAPEAHRDRLGIGSSGSSRSEWADGQSACRSHIRLGYSQEDLAERAGLHRN
jgi:hypothetical protein